MRFLRRQTLNRRAVYDNNLYVDHTNAVVMGGTNSMVLPSGNGSTERPVAPVNGSMRLNNTTGDVEVYQGYSWRALRFRESGAINIQTVGYGDATATYFGPLNPAPPLVSQSGYTWSGANLIVLVENVIQVNNVNYVVATNPSIPGETYIPQTSGSTPNASTTINIDTTNDIIYPSINLTGAAVTITGTYSNRIQAATTVVSYTTSAGQLSSITINNPTQNGTIPTGTLINIVVPTATATGSYLNFSSPIPYGKPVYVLSGFDS